MKSKTIFITRTAIIAALYAVLTLLCYPIAFGPVQFRVSEALTILPLFFAEAVPGLFIGCIIANIFGGSVIDIVLGSLATLLAAICTRLVKKIYLGVIPPVLFNALLVPVIFLTVPDITTGYWFNVLTVGAGQLIAVVGLGVPLYFALKFALKRISLSFSEKQNK